MKNTIIKVLSLVMAMVMVMGAVLVVSVSAADECKHEHYEQYGDPVPATCTEWGFTLYRCSDCNKEYRAEINTLEKPHNKLDGYEEVVKKEVAATCIADAYRVIVCSICNTEVVDVEEGTKGEAHHNWSDWTTVKSTCTEAGNKTRTCSICEKVETQALDINGHEWIALEDQVVEPKCFRYIDPSAPDNDKAAYGSMPYKCKNCDATRTVEIEPRNYHVYVDMAKNDNPKCGEVNITEAGKYCQWCYVSENGVPHEIIQHDLPAPAENACSLEFETVVCKICNATVERKVEHEFGSEPTYSQPATCDKYGYDLYGCIHCGNKFNNVVHDPIGHDWEATGKTAEPTCTTPGGIEYACANGCGKTKVDADPAAPAKGHNKTLVEVKALEPTCTEDGYTAGKYCPDCETYVEGHVKINKLGHSNVTYICTQTKLKDIVCSRCGEEKEIAATAIVIEGAVESHVWVRDDENSVDPTCTTSGTDILSCKYCSKPGTKTVPALGHDTKTETVAATCKESGYTIVTCKVCLATISNVIIPVDPNGHIGEVTKYVPATCTTDGVEIGSCVNCGKLYEKVLTKLGHDIVNIEAKDPTCTEDGNTAGSYCKREDCGEVFVKSEPITKLGHKETTVSGYAATCTTKGLEDGKKCTRCDYITVPQVEIPAFDHYYNGVQYSEIVTVVATCKDTGRIGYVAHECFYCDEAVIDQYLDAPVHSWETTWTKVDVTCETDGYEYHLCTACGAKAVKENSTVPATGHKNKAGEAISTKCTRPADFDNKCVNDHCNYADKLVPANHNYVMKDHTITNPCEGYTYDLYVCEDCGLKRIDTVDTELTINHTWEVVSKDTAAPTPEKAQATVSKCKLCGETKTEYATSAINYKYEIENLTNPGFHFVNGTKKLQVTISIFADKKEFHNIFANITYDKAVLEYKGAEIVDSISGVALESAIYKPEDGKLNLTAYVDDPEAAEVTNAVLTGEAQKFITLVFAVKADAAKGDTTISMNNITFLDKNGAKVNNAFPQVQKMIETIYVLGDANGDGIVSAKDYAAMQNLILTDGYLAEADIDGDGFVKAKDLSNLQKIVVGSFNATQFAGQRK